jgi:hypothetical protein
MKPRRPAWPRSGIVAAGLFLAVAAVPGPAQAQRKLPNIAMLTDDIGWDYLGDYSGAGLCQPTPNVDQIAKESAVCALQPGMARVWVLRQPNAPGSNVAAADPTVFANGAPFAQSAPGTVFFHDFQPGPYRFTVQPVASANPGDTLRLAPGAVAYVQLRRVPNRGTGSTAKGAGFAVVTVSPDEVKAYLPRLTYLGQR